LGASRHNRKGQQVGEQVCTKSRGLTASALLMRSEFPELGMPETGFARIEYVGSSVAEDNPKRKHTLRTSFLAFLKNGGVC